VCVLLPFDSIGGEEDENYNFFLVICVLPFITHDRTMTLERCAALKLIYEFSLPRWHLHRLKVKFWGVSPLLALMIQISHANSI
jgi:hypothetical protein